MTAAQFQQTLSQNTGPISFTMTPEQFQEVRGQNTQEAALKQLDEIGVDLAKHRTAEFNKPIGRTLLICANTYRTPKWALGVGPLNDAVTCGAHHKLWHYFVYYLHNPSPAVFQDWLRHLLSITTEYFTVYYTGHGTQVADKSGDEKDGMDEVMVFDDGYILDDDLAKLLKQTCKGKARVLLLSDCCRSGTIWDIPEDVKEAERTFPANIVAISSSSDAQTSKQAGGLGQLQAAQGLFTFHFFGLLRNNRRASPKDVIAGLNPELRKYQQTVQAFPTRAQLMTVPIFPQD